MKKILLFIDILCSGGAQRQLVQLGNLLKQKGYEVLFLDYWDSKFYDEFLNNLDKALTKKNDPQYIQLLLETAKENTWKARFFDIKEALEKLIKNKSLG